MIARLRAFAATSPGRIVLAALSLVALWPQYQVLAVVILAAAAVATLRPERRAVALSLIALLIFLWQIVPQAAAQGYKPLLFAIVWIAAALLGPRIGLLPMHAAVFAGIGALAVMNVTGIRPVAMAFAILQLSIALLWRTSYWMRWRAKAPDAAPRLSRVFALIPFFGSGGVPIGKSPEYFDRYQARDAAELAAAQMEGTKLLLLALLYRVLLYAADSSYQDALLEIAPPMDLLLAAPQQFALAARWGGIYGELLRAILELAVFGHTAVGICHWMGYRIPRNTRAPLWANSIADFWARYYFYFKELLLDFFFFPVYLRLKGFSPAARTVLATFAAACVGNFYYHALLYASPLMQSPANPEGYLQWIGARAIYGVLLAAGLSLSILRGVRNPRLARNRWMGILVSTSFFALLHIWSYGVEPFTIVARWRLLQSLFGL